MKILLDNGHGSETPGKRSPVWDNGEQLLEWQFNRTIAREVHFRLTDKGVDCELLVPEFYDVPLSERVKRANEIAKQQDWLVVSIHANAGGGTGWEIFTSPGETKSDEYATEFFNVASEVLSEWKMRKDTTDGDPDKEADFYILKKTTCPAVLTENLFMDTEKDCMFLLSDEGKEAIINLHVQAILNIVA